MIPAIPPVTLDIWTFEQCPAAPAVGFNPREAALWFLAVIDWEEVMGNLTEVDDVIEIRGTAELINDIIRWRLLLPRPFNTLHAWLTAHTVHQHICNTQGHWDDEGVRDFNYCDYATEFIECEWFAVWALMGDPVEFLRLAQRVIRGDGLGFPPHSC